MLPSARSAPVNRRSGPGSLTTMKQDESGLRTRRTSRHLDDERRGVVPTRGCESGFDHAMRRVQLRLGGIRLPEPIQNLAAEKAIGHSIGAEQKDVTRLVGDGAELRVHELMPGAERFLQRV